MSNFIHSVKGMTSLSWIRALRQTHERPRTPQNTKQSTLFVSYPIKEQILFAKRLAMILRSGMPILSGVRMLHDEATSSSAKKILRSISDDIANGSSLANALRKFENIFGVFIVNIVHVGETSGTLPENLEYIAQELRKKTDLRKKVVGALIYPAIIVFATIGITTMLIVYIFPKILPVFLSLKSALPLSTRILIWLSAFMSKNGVWLILGIIVFGIAYAVALRARTFHYIMDRVLLRIPVFGKLSQYYNLSNACRTLSLLLKSDVRIVNAIDIAAHSLKNEAYRRALLEASETTLHGQRISHYLKSQPALFPPITVQMIGVGESTGNLSESFMYLSEMYESEINDITKNLTNILEPFLMITMGLIVGFIAISIITPIYGITQNLHG
jgi:type IV pilus assembly protein PilC